MIALKWLGAVLLGTAVGDVIVRRGSSYAGRSYSACKKKFFSTKES
jgi:hypothetical protein